MPLITTGPFMGMPARHYGLAMADPPWHTVTWSPKGEPRTPNAQYATMSIDQLCGLPVGYLMADNSWLVIWVTGTHLPQAFPVITAWGFTYSGYAFQWLKETKYGGEFIGMGKTTRANMEIALLARRGRARVNARDVRELIVAPPREHSRKPYEAHLRCERLASGPYLELFARQRRPRWNAWGLECPLGKGGWRPRYDLFPMVPMHLGDAVRNVARYDDAKALQDVRGK